MKTLSQKLIDKIFNRARVLEKLNTESTQPKLSDKPIITIARDPGSGGKPTAKLVAKKLKYKFFDRKLVETIAKSARKRKQLIKDIDEKSRSAMDDIVHSMLNPEYVSDLEYVKHLYNTVLSISTRGQAVILGRGANFIVPSSDCLRVLITASKHIRIQRATKYEKISKKVAIGRINKISKDRRDFISQYFRKYYTNPKHYDLIINTDFYSINATSELVIKAFRQKFPTLGEVVKSTLKKKSRIY